MKIFELSYPSTGVYLKTNVMYPEDIALHEEVINLWEMANLSPKTTGINDIVVWVNGGGSKLKHGPRIKVCKGLRWNPQEVSTIPLFGKPRVIGNADISQEDFSKIMAWVELNKDAIMSYSRDEIATDELIALLKRI